MKAAVEKGHHLLMAWCLMNGCPMHPSLEEESQSFSSDVDPEDGSDWSEDDYSESSGSFDSGEVYSDDGILI